MAILLYISLHSSEAGKCHQLTVRELGFLLFRGNGYVIFSFFILESVSTCLRQVVLPRWVRDCQYVLCQTSWFPRSLKAVIDIATSSSSVAPYRFFEKSTNNVRLRSRSFVFVRCTNAATPKWSKAGDGSITLSSGINMTIVEFSVINANQKIGNSIVCGLKKSTLDQVRRLILMPVWSKSQLCKCRWFSAGTFSRWFLLRTVPSTLSVSVFNCMD